MANIPAGIHAKDYDDYVTQFTRPWNDYLLQRIQEEITSLMTTSKCIVDIGTGTAHTLIEMTHSPLFSSYQLIGIDFFADMVTQARLNVKHHGLENRITILQGDVHDIAMPDQSVAFIFGRSVIHHWACPSKAYQEIYRILAPGGVCIVHEPSREPAITALTKFNDLRKEFGMTDMSVKEKFTAEEVRAQLADVHLSSVSHVYEGEGLASLGFELRITK